MVQVGWHKWHCIDHICFIQLSSSCIKRFILFQELHESYKHELDIVPTFEELIFYQERHTYIHTYGSKVYEVLILRIV